VNQGKLGRVLVTGATGFVAGHCIGDLLARGYDVRGTVRNRATADLAHLRPAIDKASGSFDVAAVTLDADEGWAEAARGCDFVLHVAAPIPFKAPRHEDELIRPAVDGTTRVLTAAAPLRAKRDSSADIVRRMLAGEMPAVPPLNLAFTDVRDLAAAHRLALETPGAKGNRYICANGHLPMTGIAAILKEEYGPRGYKVATRGAVSSSLLARGGRRGRPGGGRPGRLLVPRVPRSCRR
jgi:nucleoside-diphosphate-sugar epimerase